MDPIREIGRTLTAEQNLTGEDITWLIAMAQAVLRAFAWTEGQPMRSLAATLNISPQTLYTTLRLVVQAMLWIRRGQASVATLASRLQEVQARLASVEQASAFAHAEVQRLTRVLTEAQDQVKGLLGLGRAAAQDRQCLFAAEGCFSVIAGDCNQLPNEGVDADLSSTTRMFSLPISNALRSFSTPLPGCAVTHRLNYS